MAKCTGGHLWIGLTVSLFTVNLDGYVSQSISSLLRQYTFRGLQNLKRNAHSRSQHNVLLFFEMFAFALHSLNKEVCKYHFLKQRMFTIAWLIYLVLRKERNNVTQDEKCKYIYRSLDPPLKRNNSLRNIYKMEITAI